MRNSIARFTVFTVLAVFSLAAHAQQTGITADARAIIDRHLKAAGDSAADQQIQSTRATGALLMPAQNITGTVELFSARPNKMLLKAEIPGVGKLESGFDGERGWSMDPITGPTLLSGKELTQAKFDASFDGPFENLEARYASMSVAGVETFDGRKAARINAVNVHGDKSAEFFDVETGLHAGSIATRETMMGPLEVTTFLRDYRRVHGGLEPHVLVQKMMGVEQVVRIDKIEINVVKPETFALPPAIKALIK